ncbi:MAG: SHOCT domain-containing protein [DPANN group archaeon]|nr:SHOCT domain-containing protein [DPANN group archaeon]
MYPGLNFISMILFNGLFFIITVVLVLWLAKNIKLSSDPIKILDSRYAKGEITKKEYIEIKKDLQN